MYRMKFLLSFIACGVALLLSRSIFAWVAVTNPPSVWTSLPVPYYVNNAGCADIGGFDAAVNVAETSFDTWENNDCTSWQVTYMGGTAAGPYSGNDGQNVLGWTESGWPYEPYAIGVTQNMLGGGRIWSSDIAFNAVNFTWTTTGGGGWNVDAQSIVTHEEGHFLGLDHPPCTMQQTMCASYSGGITERDLTSDDINGVCALYPGSGPPPTCTTSADCEDKYECIDGDCVGMMCAACTTHDDCGGPYDYCLSGFPDGNWYCGVNCTSDAECGAGNTCIDLGGGMRQCLPSNFDCTGSAPGCVLDSDCPAGYICQDGTCVLKPGCSVDEDCTAGYICVDGNCVYDTSPHYPICTPCTTNEECGYRDDDCVTLYPDGTHFSNGVSYCGVSCGSVGGNCGEGFQCFEFPERPSQCLPAEHVCDTCNPMDMSGCDFPDTYCDFINCFNGICRPGTPGPGLIGEKCSDDLQCQTMQCIKQVDDSFCSTTCAFQSGYDPCSSLDALNSYTCQPRDFGACGYCSCASGRLGDHCDADSDCQSGSCLILPDGRGRVCSYLCSAFTNCPTYFSCQCFRDPCEPGDWGVFPDTDADVQRPGQPCIEGEICLGGGQCDTGLGYCTRPCEGNCECPSDMHCQVQERETVNEDGSKTTVEVRICMLGAPKSGCGACTVIEKEPSTPAFVFALAFLFMSLILVLLRRKGS